MFDSRSSDLKEREREREREINAIFLLHFIETVRAEDETRIIADEMTFVRSKVKVKIFRVHTIGVDEGVVSFTLGPFYRHVGTTITH
jgi:hypothetical protein